MIFFLFQSPFIFGAFTSYTLLIHSYSNNKHFPLLHPNSMLQLFIASFEAVYKLGEPDTEVSGISDPVTMIYDNYF